MFQLDRQALLCILALTWISACDAKSEEPGGGDVDGTDGDANTETGTGTTHDTEGNNDSDGEDNTTDTDSLTALRIACIDRINGFRATLGLAPYERWQEAEACADDEARQDAVSGTAHSAFGQCGEWAQNECPGWGSYEDVVQNCLQMMWDEGPGSDFNTHGHFINMSSTDYTRAACGFFETQQGQVWAVQDFR